MLVDSSRCTPIFTVELSDYSFAVSADDTITKDILTNILFRCPLNVTVALTLLGLVKVKSGRGPIVNKSNNKNQVFFYLL